MSTLTKASRQWATRPDEERFTSLNALHTHMDLSRRRSRTIVVSSRKLTITPTGDMVSDLAVTGPSGSAALPTHWAFGQLAAKAGAPANFLRSLPAPLVADVLNYKLQFSGAAEDIGVLLRREENDAVVLRAATGPKYGRIYNAQLTSKLVSMFGDGVTGQWRVPGCSDCVAASIENTTLYGSDRDMFVFLCDEENRIEVPNRRNGQTGSLARGFFVWNSEVGAATLGAAFFLFDYVCANRIVWGAEGYIEKRIRHTVAAPDRWLETVMPVLDEYSKASAAPILATIKAAQAHRLGDAREWLAKRFTPSLGREIAAAHAADEGRPVESLYDVVTGLTAYARDLPYQSERVELERQAGTLLALAA